MKNNPKAVIVGIRGLELDEFELGFIKEHNPLGFILFSRNISNHIQLAELVKSLKAAVGRSIVPILIDQEGGRVARLKEPNWRHPPRADIFGKIALTDLSMAQSLCKENAKLLAYDLQQLGINTVCAPVLDILFPDAHGVIGDRAFSDDKVIVTKLAEAMISGLKSFAVAPIIKHIPGHGRARVDSHLELPVVDADYKDLLSQDFYPFINLHKKAKWAMTAHIVYKAIDPDEPATFSNKVITEIREQIGFESIIITDCITMKALSGTMREKASKSFSAGCDVVLHSSGKLDEMLDVIEVSPSLNDRQWQIIRESYDELGKPVANFDFVEVSNNFDRKLEQYNDSQENGIDPTMVNHAE